jgi:hypothetical protein
MTTRVDFVYLELGKDESFNEIWTTVSKESSTKAELKHNEAVGGPSKALGQGAGSSSEVAEPPLKKAKTEGEQQSVVTPLPKKRGKAVDANLTPEKAENKSINKDIAALSAKGNKLKARFHEATSGVATLVASVDAGDEWSWLQNSPALMKPLTEASKAMQSCLSPFGRAFIDLGLKDARGKMDPVAVLSSLRDFVEKLEPNVQNVEKQLKFLRSTHALQRESC